jgi:hypothetical protein
MEALAIYMGHSVAMQVGAGAGAGVGVGVGVVARRAARRAARARHPQPDGILTGPARRTSPTPPPRPRQRDTYDRRTRDQKVSPAIALMERLSSRAAQ